MFDYTDVLPVHDTLSCDVLVAVWLARIVEARPTGPVRHEIVRDLRRLARRHPTYRSALYRTARTIAASK